MSNLDRHISSRPSRAMAYATGRGVTWARPAATESPVEGLVDLKCGLDRALLLRLAADPGWASSSDGLAFADALRHAKVSTTPRTGGSDSARAWEPDAVCAADNSRGGLERCEPPKLEALFLPLPLPVRGASPAVTLHHLLMGAIAAFPRRKRPRYTPFESRPTPAAPLPPCPPHNLRPCGLPDENFISKLLCLAHPPPFFHAVAVGRQARLRTRRDKQPRQGHAAACRRAAAPKRGLGAAPAAAGARTSGGGGRACPTLPTLHTLLPVCERRVVYVSVRLKSLRLGCSLCLPHSQIGDGRGRKASLGGRLGSSPGGSRENSF